MVTGALSDHKLLNQWFYEDGGIMQHVCLTILTSVGTDIVIVLGPLALLRRYVLALFATSQAKLNKLWMPPHMHLGRIYAYSLRTISVRDRFKPRRSIPSLLAAPAGAPICARRHGRWRSSSNRSTR